MDGRRQAGWLPEQDGLADWLTGHRERAEAKGEQAPLHAAVAEFGQLIDRDPVVRMLVNRMIDEVPHSKQYAKRHVECRSCYG